MKFVSGPENVLTLKQTKVAVGDVMSSVSAMASRYKKQFKPIEQFIKTLNDAFFSLHYVVIIL